MNMITVLETDRLVLRRIALTDAPFVLNLVNQPSWLEFIGDHEVYNLDQACDYIIDGPQTMFAEHGFALSLVELKGSAQPIGLCGLVKRDALPDPDLGFAFLPQFWRQAYAYEAAAASLSYGRDRLGIKKVLALTKPDNERSIRLLQRLGFQFMQLFRLPDDEVDVNLFAHHISSGA